MNQKPLTISLIVLLILPVICLAGNIEIGDIKLKWEKDFGTPCTLLAKIPAINCTDKDYSIRGKFLFYDKDGFELCKIPFWGEVKAREGEVLQVSGWVTDWDYEETASLKVTIETKPSDWLGVKAEPLIFERELRLPLRDVRE